MKCDLCKENKKKINILDGVCYECILSSDVPVHIPLNQIIKYIRQHYKNEKNKK